MKNNHCLVVLFLAAAFSVFPVSLSSLIDRPDEEFPLSETVTWGEDETTVLTLLPDLPGARSIEDRFQEFSPEITVQRLYRIKLPEGIDGNTAEERLRLFTKIVNLFGRPETQVGYTYYSRTRERDIVLFDESFISDKRGRPVEGFNYNFSSLPDEIEYYQLVDEANFSSTVFLQKIMVNRDYIRFSSTNTERIWMNIIPIMKSGGTRNELLIFIHDGYLYTFNCTQIAKIPTARKLGIPVNIPSMFRKRMDVMARWMEEQFLLSY